MARKVPIPVRVHPLAVDEFKELSMTFRLQIQRFMAILAEMHDPRQHPGIKALGRHQYDFTGLYRWRCGVAGSLRLIFRIVAKDSHGFFEIRSDSLESDLRKIHTIQIIALMRRESVYTNELPIRQRRIRENPDLQ